MKICVFLSHYYPLPSSLPSVDIFLCDTGMWLCIRIRSLHTNAKIRETCLCSYTMLKLGPVKSAQISPFLNPFFVPPSFEFLRGTPSWLSVFFLRPLHHN